MKDLFLFPADGELAPALDVLGVNEVEGAKAGLGGILEEDIPPLAKVSLPILLQDCRSVDERSW